jgi:hypothetical protein
MDDLSSQSLCLTCGLCCDGTLFPFVRLKPDDEITPLEAAGINIILDSNSDGLATGQQLAVVEGANVSNSGPIFEQPCAAHKNCVLYMRIGPNIVGPTDVRC